MIYCTCFLVLPTKAAVLLPGCLLLLTATYDNSKVIVIALVITLLRMLRLFWLAAIIVIVEWLVP